MGPLSSRSLCSLLIVHERTSRQTKIIRQRNRSAPTTRDSTIRLFDAVPANLRRTLTIDNGIENAIGRLRRFLPRRTMRDQPDDGAIEKINRAYNESPRKCLARGTPDEVFSDIIKRVAFETWLHAPPESARQPIEPIPRELFFG
jgi:transposase, IS30 family